MDRPTDASAAGGARQDDALWPRLKRSLARYLRAKGLRPPLPPVVPGAPAAPAPRRAPALPHLAPKPAETGQVKDYAVPLDRTAWPTRAVLKLSSPQIGPSGKISFAEHPLTASGEAGREVIAVLDNSVWHSRDLGATWRSHPLAGPLPAELCFTTSTGCRLIASHLIADEGDTATRAFVQRYTPDWRPDGEPLQVCSTWHGSCSIGEAGGVILFAEYPVNRGKYDGAEKFSLIDRLVSNPRVFRSRDDGLTWDVCFQVSSEQIRHLHTVAPDPETPGRWWLTSGDRAAEVFVWRSDDDGDSWTDVTADVLGGPLNRNCRPRACQRQTDQVFHDGWMIWGSDDWLGNVGDWDNGDDPAVGSRIFKARTTGEWIPQEIGFCGSPVRSIVDVGPAWIFITEAKVRAITWRPDTYLVFKDDLSRVHRFVQIDNWAETSTGFTYSRASRKALDGVFFSFRGVRDVFARGPRLLRWEIEFY